MEPGIEWSQQNPLLVQEIVRQIERLEIKRDGTDDPQELLSICQVIQSNYEKLGRASFTGEASSSQYQVIGLFAYAHVIERKANTVH